MLSETFIAAVSAPPKDPSTNTSLLKDAGIFVHSFQPQPALRSTFKKSASPANCVAISETHVYTAQAGKALVHVYGREKGKQEATVPFAERIHSIALAADDTVLVLGTENGSILLWEICTGRQISAPQSHLQAVTALAVDPGSNFLLSGSADSNVLVWSLLDLLAFPSASSTTQDGTKAPRHTLSSHRDGITSLATGHAFSSANIAVSASKDGTAAVWNYHNGELLRTILLPSTPLCLALDPADRAFFTGYEDGSVQLVDFYTTTTVSSIQDSSLAATPVQPPPSSRWNPPSQITGNSTLSISLSYDGTTLISGHASGRILAWDVAAGRFQSQLAEYGGSPITNIAFLTPTGFPNARASRQKIVNVVKPRPHDAFSTPGNGRLVGAYKFSTQFTSKLSCGSVQIQETAFEAALNHVGFPAAYLNESLSELLSTAESSVESSAPAQSASAPDFMSLDPPSTTQQQTSSTAQTNDEKQALQIAALQKQVKHLKKLQDVSNTQIAKLAAERTVMMKNEEKTEKRRARKQQRRQDRGRKEWEDLGVRDESANGNEEDVGMADDGSDLSSTSGESTADEESYDEE